MFADLIKQLMPAPSTPADPPKPVLVVDDEPVIRMVVRRILEAAGYTVIEACDGGDALEKAGPEPSLLLVVADVNMPGMSGDEMARRFRARQPALNCLFLTGCVDQLFEGRPILWEGEAFLEKPFTDRGLRDAVSLQAFGHLAGPTVESPQSWNVGAR